MSTPGRGKGQATSPEQLRALADDAECRGHWFLAAALSDYQIRHGLSDQQLAAELGIPVGDLDRLKLCFWPATPADYRAIARSFGLRVVDLRRVVGPAPP